MASNSNGHEHHNNGAPLSGNLPPRKQSSTRGPVASPVPAAAAAAAHSGPAAPQKYMQKGMSQFTLLENSQRNFIQELMMISAEARRIPSFYGMMKKNQEDAVELLQTAAKVQQKLDNVARRSQSALRPI